MKTVRNLFLAVLFTTALAAANPAEVNNITLERTNVRAGQTVTATVHLKSPAPAGGMQVELWSDEIVSVPSYVTVPAGQTSVSFHIKTSSDTGNASAHVAAIQPQASASSSLQLYSAPALTKK